MDGEHSFWIDGRSGRLSAMLHLPAGRTAAGVVVMCPASFEEQKTAGRCFFDTARTLAAGGWAALRFDYFGTGDSEGEHASASVGTHLLDIADAVAFARARVPGAPLCLLGLRLGATIACRAAAGLVPPPERLVLWEPVVSGRKLMDRERKRQLVRKMMTGKDAGTAGATAPASGGSAPNDVLDLEGYAVSRTMQAEIEDLDLAALLPSAGAARVLVVQISFQEQLAPDLAAAVAAARKAAVAVETRSVVMPPVWNRLDPFDWSAPGEATAQWLAAPAGP